MYVVLIDNGDIKRSKGERERRKKNNSLVSMSYSARPLLSGPSIFPASVSLCSFSPLSPPSLHFLFSKVSQGLKAENRPPLPGLSIHSWIGTNKIYGRCKNEASVGWEAQGSPKVLS